MTVTSKEYKGEAIFTQPPAQYWVSLRLTFLPRLSSGVGPQLRSSTLHRRLVLLRDLWSNERQFSFYNLKFIIQSDMMYKNQYLELNI